MNTPKEPAVKDDNWLQIELDSAEKEVQNWPDWMKKSSQIKR